MATLIVMVIIYYNRKESAMRNKYSPEIRIILLYQALLSGIPLTRQSIMDKFEISSRTLDRDISKIRTALSEMNTLDIPVPFFELKFDVKKNSYVLTTNQ